MACTYDNGCSDCRFEKLPGSHHPCMGCLTGLGNRWEPKARAKRRPTRARFKFPRFEDFWKCVNPVNGKVGILTADEIKKWSAKVFKVARELQPLR
jgi:hypothetical protein